MRVLLLVEKSLGRSDNAIHLSKERQWVSLCGEGGGGPVDRLTYLWAASPVGYRAKS
jgi:hypothetical protein